MFSALLINSVDKAKTIALTIGFVLLGTIPVFLKAQRHQRERDRVSHTNPQVEDETNKAKPPYRLFFHPYKTLLDSILSCYFNNLVLQLHKFQVCDTKLLKTRKMIHLQLIRQLMTQFGKLSMKFEIFKWNWYHFIVSQTPSNIKQKDQAKNGCVGKKTLRKGRIQTSFSRIPRIHDILYTWNILPNEEKGRDNGNNLTASKRPENGNSDSVDISIHCSTDIVLTPSSGSPGSNQNGENRSVLLSSLKEQIGNLSSKDHILLHFWGGGMTTKMDSGYILSFANALIQAHLDYVEDRFMKQKSKENCGSGSDMDDGRSDHSHAIPPNMIIVTPEYRLAPENPFPASVIDCLSVLEFFIKHVPKEVPIHICGISAGGNLAAVSVLEGHRRYPGRIQSALLYDPMLAPKCDSMSYYLNSRMGLASWVIWSWQVYLSIDNQDQQKHTRKNKGKYASFESYHDFVTHGSNRGSVERSRFVCQNTTTDMDASTVMSKALEGREMLVAQPQLWRIIEPIYNIPNGLESECAPKLIVTAALGDPLHDEGVEFFKALKQKGANVTLLEARSSHAAGWQMDSKFQKQLTEAWRSAVFDKRKE